MARVDKVLAEHLASEEHPLQVDADDAVELVFGDVEERCCRVDPGAIDDDVNTAGALQDGAEQRFSFRFAGRFCGMEPCAPSGSLDRGEPRPGLLCISTDDHDLGARGRKSPGHRTAQARRCRR